ncbi:putative anion-transporting ATPase [Gordonia paraffinivorans NBRC 108238]|uniref:Anion-transporting ATPase n=2 Tax=Gordonia paraffinivorans TaxID=175628 RepID=A0ABQ0IPG2_9ACTN|nr:putative anion-transporting ATPase [Gordonia paraffinivorans NBRC 108238]VFA88570.1 Arsenical pump-driving ATPase [Gordonia paraffinivorans]
MTDNSSVTVDNEWPDAASRARLHFVSGKGGTGKTTIAAALALALAADGKKVLLVETEGRQGIAQVFDIPPLPPADTRIATAEGGGEVSALAIDIEHALLEYLDMFYNLGFAGRAMKRIGAIDFVTTVAPGLRDVLLTGKIKERVIHTDKQGNPVYDAVVVDAPPTGRIGNFLDVTQAMADLAKTGPIRSQSEGVAQLLHSEQTVVHLVTLLEAMPIQETIEAIDELRGKNLNLGSLIINRVSPPYLPADSIDEIAEGRIDAVRIEENLKAAGLKLAEGDLSGLLTETIEHATRLQAQQIAKAQLDEVELPMLELPSLGDGIDLGSIYELANLLQKAGA